MADIELAKKLASAPVTSDVPSDDIAGGALRGLANVYGTVGDFREMLREKGAYPEERMAVWGARPLYGSLARFLNSSPTADEWAQIFGVPIRPPEGPAAVIGKTVVE